LFGFPRHPKFIADRIYLFYFLKEHKVLRRDTASQNRIQPVSEPRESDHICVGRADRDLEQQGLPRDLQESVLVQLERSECDVQLL
jgi:hypothetical protein